MPHGPLKEITKHVYIICKIFPTQYVYSGQYVYFFSTIVNPIRLFRPIRLLGIQEYLPHLVNVVFGWPLILNDASSLGI